MGKTLSKAMMLAMAAGVMATPAAIAEGEFSLNAALTSDYVWRGVSQSGEDPAIQIGADYANSGFYVGTWASNVDFGPGSDAEVELDFYGGYGGELAPGVSFDIGYIHYVYPGTDGEDLDFGEVYAGLSYEADSGLGLGAYIYNDFDNENTYIEGTASYGFTDALSGDVSVGNYAFDGGADYTAWSVGGTYSFENFDIDLRYWDTDIEDQLGNSVPEAEERLVLTLSTAIDLAG